MSTRLNEPLVSNSSNGLAGDFGFPTDIKVQSSMVLPFQADIDLRLRKYCAPLDSWRSLSCVSICLNLQSQHINCLQTRDENDLHASFKGWPGAVVSEGGQLIIKYSA